VLQLLEDVLEKIYREQEAEEVDGKSGPAVHVQPDDRGPVVTPRREVDV
jgi:hypothetical protein